MDTQGSANATPSLTFDQHIDRAVFDFRETLTRYFPDGSREISIARTHLDTAALWAKSHAAQPGKSLKPG